MVIADAPDGGGGDGTDQSTEETESTDSDGTTAPVGGETPPDRSDSGDGTTDSSEPDTGETTSPVGGETPPDQSGSGDGTTDSSEPDTGDTTSPVGGETPPDQSGAGGDPGAGERTGTGIGSSPPGGQAPPDGYEPDTGGQTSPPSGRGEPDPEPADPTQGTTTPVGGDPGPGGGGLDVPAGVTDERASDIRREVASQDPAVFFSDVQLGTEPLSNDALQKRREEAAANVRQRVAEERGVDPSQVQYTAADVEFEQQPQRIVASVDEAGRERAAEYDIAQKYDVDPLAIDLTAEDGQVRLTGQARREAAAAQSDQYGAEDLTVADGEVRLSDTARREAAAEEWGVSSDDVQIVPSGTGTSPVAGRAPPEDDRGQARLTEEGVAEYAAENSEDIAGIGTVEVETLPSGVREITVDDPSREEPGYDLGRGFDRLGDAASPITDPIADAAEPITTPVGEAVESNAEEISFGILGDEGLASEAGNADRVEGITNPDTPLRNWIQDRGEEFEPVAEAAGDVATAGSRLPANLAEAYGLMDEESAQEIRDRSEPIEQGVSRTANVPLWADDAAALGQAGAYVAAEGDAAGIPARAGEAGETGVATAQVAGEYAAENPVETISGAGAGAVIGYGIGSATRSATRSARRAGAGDSSTSQRLAEARTRAGDLRERSPLGVELDADAPLIDVADDLPARSAARAQELAYAPADLLLSAGGKARSSAGSGVSWARQAEPGEWAAGKISSQVERTARTQARSRARQLEGVASDDPLRDPLGRVADPVADIVEDTARTQVRAREQRLGDVPAGEPLIDPLGRAASRIRSEVDTWNRARMRGRRESLGDLDTDAAPLGPDEPLWSTPELPNIGERLSNPITEARRTQYERRREDLDDLETDAPALSSFAPLRGEQFLGGGSFLRRAAPDVPSPDLRGSLPDIDTPSPAEAVRQERSAFQFRAAEVAEEGWFRGDASSGSLLDDVPNPRRLGDLTLRVGSRPDGDADSAPSVLDGLLPTEESRDIGWMDFDPDGTETRLFDDSEEIETPAGTQTTEADVGGGQQQLMRTRTETRTADPDAQRVGIGQEFDLRGPLAGSAAGFGQEPSMGMSEGALFQEPELGAGGRSVTAEDAMGVNEDEGLGERPLADIFAGADTGQTPRAETRQGTTPLLAEQPAQAQQPLLQERGTTRGRPRGPPIPFGFPDGQDDPLATSEDDDFDNFWSRPVASPEDIFGP